MADTFSKKQRSAIMRAVKSKGNQSTEIKLMALLKARHITGWRRNYKILGRPDFVFPQKRVALFADGCFWHGHTCRNVTPSDNAAYWQNKIARNRARDRTITRALTRQGWRVVRLWECQIQKGKLQKLAAALTPRRRPARDAAHSNASPHASR